MTLLITGGLGYIGSHAVVAFSDAGHDIVIVDTCINSDADVFVTLKTLCPTTIVRYDCDIRDQQGLQKIFADHNISAVIHFAARKSVGESCEDPLGYRSNNVTGTQTLCTVMREYGVSDMIFSSTCASYDTMKYTAPYDETTPMKPLSPYGSSKMANELLLKDLATHAGMRVVALRYFNPIGAHPSGLIGENPRGTPSNLLPYVLGVAVGSFDHVRVWGDAYETIDGTGVRDYIHIADIIDAHVRALDSMDGQSEAFCVYNVGTGEGTSVKQMIEIVAEVTGKDIPFVIYPPRDGDAACVFADASKIQKILGRKTQYSIKQAVSDARNFWKQQKKEKKKIL